jgi:hypothetical protein
MKADAPSVIAYLIATGTLFLRSDWYRHQREMFDVWSVPAFRA